MYLYQLSCTFITRLSILALVSDVVKRRSEEVLLYAISYTGLRAVSENKNLPKYFDLYNNAAV